MSAAWMSARFLLSICLPVIVSSEWVPPFNPLHSVPTAAPAPYSPSGWKAWKEPLGGVDKPLTNDQLTQTVFKQPHGSAICVQVSQYLPYHECAAWQNLWDLYQSPEIGMKFGIDPHDWCGSDVYTTVNMSMDYNWARTDPCRCSRIKCHQVCLTPPPYIPPIDARTIYGTITPVPTPAPRATNNMKEFPHEYIDYFHVCNKSAGFISEIDFSGLNLPGPIPEMIFNFTNLLNLTLRNNLFTGPIREELFNLRNLTYVDMSANRLLGTLSESITHWHSLSFLDLHQNQLHGPLPLQLENVTQLHSINLAANQFSGPIPVEYGRSLVNLRKIELQGNRLTREFPETFDQLVELEHLDLSNNYITGTMPRAFFTNLCDEQEALLSKSPYKREILAGKRHFNLLKHLNLQHNKLVGTIPREIGLSCFWIEYLLLGDNKLSGTIPSDMFIEMTKVFSFDVGSNLLTGVLPTSLTYLPRLSELDASHNQLHGDIGHYITNVSIYWTDPGYDTKFEPKPLLSRVKLHNNLIGGELPQELADIAYLEFLSVQNNNIGGPIPKNVSWAELEGCGLSGNSWTCPVPCAVLANASCDIPLDYCAGDCDFYSVDPRSDEGYTIHYN